MDPATASAVAFPAVWFFVLGVVLAFGVLRTYRERHDVTTDWNELLRFHEALTRVEATGGRDGAALLDLRALAEALDDSVAPEPGRPGLASQAARIDPGKNPGADARAAVIGLRQDVLAVDRALQARMRTQAKSQGNAGRLFLAGVGGVLLLPLDLANFLGLVRRYTVRRLEQSLWFHAALGVILFALLVGTVFAAIATARVLPRLLESIGS